MTHDLIIIDDALLYAAQCGIAVTPHVADSVSRSIATGLPSKCRFVSTDGCVVDICGSDVSIRGRGRKAINATIDEIGHDRLLAQYAIASINWWQ